MIIETIRGLPWAIRPSKLAEINAFLDRYEAGEPIPEDIKAAIGKPGPKSDRPYQLENGIATIHIEGVLSKRINMLSDISGGTSTQILQSEISRAVNDPQVHGILLVIDSPGGSVDGTKELSDTIFSARGIKPIVVYADGLMASAAYWIGSAADAIVTNDTAMIGSIGVAMTHEETSAQDAVEGVKKTEIYAGKYKRLASSTKPLTEEGKAYLQSMVDTYYSLFVESVAKNRGISAEDALKMADGKEFIGKQALEVGLVDFIGTRETALAQIKLRSAKSMDIKTLQEKHPDLFAQVKTMGSEEAMQAVEKTKAEAKAEGIKEERARVIEILGAEGDHAVSVECVKSGMEAGHAFKKLFEAEKSGKAARLDALKKNAPAGVGHEIPKGDPQKETFEAEVAKLVAEGKSKTEAMKIVMTQKPALYSDFEQRENQKRGA